MSKEIHSAFFTAIFWVILATAFILPSISVNEQFPSFQFVDFFLPVIFVLLAAGFNKSRIAPALPFIAIWSLLAVVILLSMAANNRLGHLRDHFEIMKAGKFILVFGFCCAFADRLQLMKVLKGIFLFLLAFNFLHYINFGGFNERVIPWYAAEIHVDYFGIDTLGNPATKRILGTMGNPNNNAILFLFFSILFFPKKNSSFKQQSWFLLAVFAVLACQSRTGFIALGAVYFTGAVIRKFSVKEMAVHLSAFIAFFLFLHLLGNVYIGSLADKDLMKYGSTRGRLETWALLWEMIKEKPFLGHGPFKEFFNENNLFSESEYFLYMWRYGFTGLLVLFAIYFYPAVTAVKNAGRNYAFELLLFSIILLITSLTNNPLSNQNILLMFAVLSGLFAGSRKPEV